MATVTKVRKDGLTEIRWHGRGGQGVVTASKMLAQAALVEGKYFQALPEFGAERSGAPIRAYTRISNNPVRQHCSVTDPGIVVVLDPTLVGAINVAEGVGEEGIIIANTPLSPQELRRKLGLVKGRVLAVDATRISLDTIGRNIPNTPILGALLKAIPVVKKESVLQAIKDRLGTRVNPNVVEGNLRAFERAYSEAKEG